jgi:hypothetical protein
MSGSENIEPTEYEIFLNKKTDKIYMSKSFDITQLKPSSEEGITELSRPIRYISKVLDCEQNQFIKIGKEIVLRVTSSARQEITAKFYEDTRGIFTLQIQKFSTDTGNPHQTYFTFVGDEIGKLYNFIRNIPLLPIEGKGKQQFEDKYLDKISLTKHHLLKFISEQPEIIPELLDELQKNNISQSDIRGLGHRKEQLEIFRNMLDTENYFENLKAELKIDKDESVWQRFFENNTWILGYGLNYIFNSELDEKKLEQVTKGYDFNSSGKKVDLFMKTRGLINSFCFGEIKTHKTPLLKQQKYGYRRECWAADDELAGGVAQIHKTVQKSIENIKTKTEIKDKNGELTSEQLYLYQPKSFIIIGSLKEFEGQNGINEDKFSSFELFRKNMFNPEIITFDELYERARHIVKNPLSEVQNINEKNNHANTPFQRKNFCAEPPFSGEVSPIGAEKRI